MGSPLQVLSLGAGVQSTTLLLMSCRGVLPKPDAAVFADTGWEPPQAYEHLTWLEGVAASAGIPVYRVGEPTLCQDALASRQRVADGQRWASMPLFTRDANDAQGRIRRQCSKEYKIVPFDRFVRRELLGLAKGQHALSFSVDKWIGISADETRRVRMSPARWCRHIYPLVGLPYPLLDRSFTRTACIEWIKENFPGVDVPRSACLGCPFHSNREWRWIKARPELWADVVEFDRAIRTRGDARGEMFLHRKAVPLEDVNFNEDQGEFWLDECLGVCGN